MPKLFYMQFVTKEWRADVAGLSACAIGCWIQICAAMWDDGQRGVLTGTMRDLASKCGLQADEFGEGLLELQDKKIGDITPDLSLLNEKEKITVICRRMKRESDRKNKKNQKTDAEKLENNENEVEENTSTRVCARFDSDSDQATSGSGRGSTEGDAAGVATHSRASEIAKLWNAVPGNTVMFYNPTGVQPLSEAVDAARETYQAAGKPFPTDAQLLAAIHRIAKKRQADGLHDVFKPKTLAGTLQLAVQVALGEVDLSVGPRPRQPAPAERPQPKPVEDLNLRKLADAEPPPWWSDEEKAAHRAKQKGGSGG